MDWVEAESVLETTERNGEKIVMRKNQERFKIRQFSTVYMIPMGVYII